jgi:hypothetical protein
MGVLARWLRAHFQKQPVPLKRALAAMDPRKLMPEYELHAFQDEPLSHDMLETLGTDEYLAWRIVDRNREWPDPACVAHLFVSYFTGKPDLVPHVPEECIQAGGANLVGLPETVEIPVPGVGAPQDRIAVRVLTFEAARGGGAALPAGPAGVDTFRVLYFFHVNGKYRTTRYEVRLAQKSLFDKYAYYAKIEVRFGDHAGRQHADRDQSVAALGPLLRKIMPILLEDHLADWEALNSDAAGEVASRG